MKFPIHASYNIQFELDDFFWRELGNQINSLKAVVW